VKVRFLADAKFQSKVIAGVLRREARINFFVRCRGGFDRISGFAGSAACCFGGSVVLTTMFGTMVSAFAEFTSAGPSGGVLLVAQNVPVDQLLTR